MDVCTDDIGGVASVEAEHEPVLVVHADAPGTGAVALQLFQLVSRALQVIQCEGGIEHVELSLNDLPEPRVDLPGRLRGNAVVDVLGRAVAEGNNHAYMIHDYRVCVNEDIASRTNLPWRGPCRSEGG